MICRCVLFIGFFILMGEIKIPKRKKNMSQQILQNTVIQIYPK